MRLKLKCMYNYDIYMVGLFILLSWFILFLILDNVNDYDLKKIGYVNCKFFNEIIIIF